MDEKPTYKVCLTHNDGIAELVITGSVPGHCVDKMQQDIEDIVKPLKPKRLLADLRSLQMHYSVTDTYMRVRSYPPFLRVRTAVVDSPENSDFQKFHENTANNAGIPTKFFTDIEKARDWLKGSEAP